MRPALGVSVRTTALLAVIAVALLVASSGRQQVEATVQALTIDNPSQPTNYGSAPVDIPVTFTWSESHVCGPYRSTITIGSLGDPVVQQTFLYEPGDEIRSAPPICDLSQGTETYTFTHVVSVPAGTPAGTYDLTVHVEENWSPGSDSWGFDQIQTLQSVIVLGGAEEALVYIATGDSIPAGDDLARGKKRSYPAILCAELRNVGPTDCKDKLPHAGDTTDDYIKRQLTKAVAEQGDLVTVTVGANDILESFLRWRIFRDCDIPTARTNLSFILTTLLSQTDSTIVLTGYYNPVNPSNDGPPLFPWGNMEACVLEGNNAIHEIVVSLSAIWPGRIIEVPLYERFKGHEFGTSDPWIVRCRAWPCRLAVGGIHPNDAGHAVIAEEIMNHIGD